MGNEMRAVLRRVSKKFRTVIVVLVAMWVGFILDLFLPLEQLALYPRQISGLPGILFSPFLHLDLSHIVSNSLPLLALLTLLVGSRGNSRNVLITVIVISGALLWLFGRPVGVVGASGLVFGLIGFLIASGIFERRFITLIVSIFVGVTYGSTLFTGILPGQPGVSWDGHLYGVIAGVISAWLFTRR